MIEFFGELWKTLVLVARNALSEMSDITKSIALIKEKKEGESDFALYLRGLKRLTVAVVAFPIPLLVIGIIGNLQILISIAGLVWAFTTLTLFALGTPIGLLVGVLFGTEEPTGHRYVKAVLNVLLLELSFTLFISIVPIQNNIVMLPIALVAVAIVGILGLRGEKTRFNRKFVGTVASGFVIVFSFSCFLPSTFALLRDWKSGLDEKFRNAISGIPEAIDNMKDDIKIFFTEKHNGKLSDGEEQFIVMKKERRPTAWFKPGERKRIWSDKPFYGLSFQERFNKPDTAIRYEMGPGWSCWYYDNYPGNEGYLIAEGIEDSTTLKIFPSQ